MKPNLKDLDEIFGSLNPELQCGEGVLTDVCRWYVAFKKQLEEKLELALEFRYDYHAHEIIREILGEEGKNEK